MYCEALVDKNFAFRRFLWSKPDRVCKFFKRGYIFISTPDLLRRSTPEGFTEAIFGFASFDMLLLKGCELT